MSITIGIVLIAVLIALIVASRRNQPATVNRPPLPNRGQSKPNTQFHAVSIHFVDSACEAAKSMTGKRFLAGAAPRIPLPECNAPECKCRFVHHDDRRSGVDRRGQYVPNGLAGNGGYTGKERRYRGDRRGGNEPQNFFT